MSAIGMDPAGALRQVWVVARRELALGLLRRSGLVVMAAILLLGLVPSLLRAALHPEERVPGSTETAAQARVLAEMYGADTARSLAGCPPALTSLVVMTMMLLPILVLLLGHGTVAGELQPGSLRYLAVRCRRWALALGKGLGVFLLVGSMLVTVHVLLWLALLGLGGSHQIVTRWGLRLLLAGLVYALPYAGLALLASSLGRSGAQALAIGLLLLVCIWLLRVVSGGAGTAPELVLALPGANERLLVGGDWRSFAVATARTGAWTLGCVAVAVARVQRRDL